MEAENQDPRKKNNCIWKVQDTLIQGQAMGGPGGGWGSTILGPGSWCWFQQLGLLVVECTLFSGPSVGDFLLLSVSSEGGFGDCGSVKNVLECIQMVLVLLILFFCFIVKDLRRSFSHASKPSKWFHTENMRVSGTAGQHGDVHDCTVEGLITFADEKGFQVLVVAAMPGRPSQTHATGILTLRRKRVPLSSTYIVFKSSRFIHSSVPSMFRIFIGTIFYIQKNVVGFFE